MMNSFNDIKMFLASSKNNATRHFNHCVWWRPYNSSEDYGTLFIVIYCHYCHYCYGHYIIYNCLQLMACFHY